MLPVQGHALKPSSLNTECEVLYAAYFLRTAEPFYKNSFFLLLHHWCPGGSFGKTVPSVKCFPSPFYLPNLDY